ncbi:MAG: protein-disulfide reductase DsbD [Alysiella sp.]|uniref:protein-disulfide reductase DsbD n=1 Tax=Alysiella sp. TaxID=1872483 RepID=UPI0026DAE165|nr:protein-disulfide reductase DsbD [Alysiella sp.]MDO4433889.1 protein-disulfide reductase DsbD [Alysiella sp.]
MKKIFCTLLLFCGLLPVVWAAVDPAQLLSPEEAFVPVVQVNDKAVSVQFDIADGYYLYQSKITAQTDVEGILAEPVFSPGKEKEDEFFGKQQVYYHNGGVTWPLKNTDSPYKLTLHYQGCADVGVCYPPVETEFNVSGSGVYQAPFVMEKGVSLFLKKSQGGARVDSVATPSFINAESHNTNNRFKLSRDTLGLNLLAFFVAGVALSLTACMYPLLPIVSSIIVGDKSSSKRRAFILSVLYVQGLALTYALVGVIAGLTGALLTIWLQQVWVVLAASAIMVLLALAMFGVFNLQLPAAVQSHFQNKSNQLSGGKMVSVFGMGMLSALIVGPCVAPPLAFALGYIGQTGDAVLGGVALYVLALGTGIPLILVGTFGGHILPRAGKWMDGIKYAFGVILLFVAVYLASPYLGYAVSATLYTALLIVPAALLLWGCKRLSGSLKVVMMGLASILAIGGIWFGVNSFTMSGTTVLHGFLTLHEPDKNAVQGQKMSDVQVLKDKINQMLADQSGQPVLLDFYADWCVSCKEMEAKTFNQSSVQAAIPMERLLKIDVTANTPEHRDLLKEYGLFGPPGLFILKTDGSRSEALLGYVPPDEFIAWYNEHIH